jgi:hypothetical protein
MNAGSRVRIDGQLIGAIRAGATGTAGQDLIIDFSSGATPARVKLLMEALRYRNSNQVAPTEGTRTITYTLNDGTGTANGGSDTATFTSTVRWRASTTRRPPPTRP